MKLDASKGDSGLPCYDAKRCCMQSKEAVMNPLHLLCVIADPGGFVGAELTVRATGVCFPVLGYVVESEPQYVDLGKPMMELAFIHSRLFVEVDAETLLLNELPHGTACEVWLGNSSARVEIDWSKLDVERLYV
jgi:hypothetical protein